MSGSDAMSVADAGVAGEPIGAICGSAFGNPFGRDVLSSVLYSGRVGRSADADGEWPLSIRGMTSDAPVLGSVRSTVDNGTWCAIGCDSRPNAVSERMCRGRGKFTGMTFSQWRRPT